MEAVLVSLQKYQVVIPRAVRAALGIRARPKNAGDPV